MQSTTFTALPTKMCDISWCISSLELSLTDIQEEDKLMLIEVCKGKEGWQKDHGVPSRDRKIGKN